ncbi:MAG: hypothetical protein ACRDQD_29935 [Nocardioidaceae bacterium]
MEVLKLHSKRIATLRLISPVLWILPTHWSTLLRRTLLCPAQATCPLCKMERPKRRGYGIAQIALAPGAKNEGLLELTEDVLAQLENRGFDPTHATGWTWRMERRDNRPGWRLLGHDIQGDTIATDAQLVPAAIEQLYALPPTMRPGPAGLRPEIISDLRDWQVEQAHCLMRRAATAAYPHTGNPQ